MAQSSIAAPADRLLLRPTWDGFLSWFTTVDHKKLGILYIVSSFAFMGLAAIEAFLIRLQLLTPEMQVVNPDQFNQLFTMHGVTMVFLAIMPLGIGLANYFVPLLIGARDLAFPGSTPSVTGSTRSAACSSTRASSWAARPTWAGWRTRPSPRCRTTRAWASTSTCSASSSAVSVPPPPRSTSSSPSSTCARPA